MNKYFVLIILLFFDCDPGWIYKINDQKIGDGTSLYKYKDSNSIMSVSSRDFALRTYINIQISIRTDSVELQPLNAYFRSNHSLKNLQISENIWFKLIRDNEIILYNRYEIPSYLIGDTVFLD